MVPTHVRRREGQEIPTARLDVSPHSSPLRLEILAFISGGAALSNDTENFLKRMGYAVVQGYGMTETRR